MSNLLAINEALKIGIKKHLISIFLIFITISYFSIGIFNTYYYGPTVDEFAHIGATNSNSRGVANNGEHPILLKTVNAILIKIKYKNFTATESEQYKLGSEFLFDSQYQGMEILRYSRFIYLAFNYLPILLLYLLTINNLLSKNIFGWFSIFYIFSPAFISNSNLLTFDVAGSWTALLFIVINYIYFNRYTSTNRTTKLWLGLLFVSTFCLALNTKYSNVILLPILLIFNILALVFPRLNQSNKKPLNFFLSYAAMSILALVTFYITIYGLYSFSFGNSNFVFGRHSIINKNLFFNQYYNLLEYTNQFGGRIQRLLLPIKWYMSGLSSVFLRSGEPSYTSFFHGQNINKTFLEYNLGLLPFKENPLVLIGLLCAMPVALWRSLATLKRKHSSAFNPKKALSVIILLILLLIFPLMYLLLSKDSKLTIGYRHFFPILIFGYLFAAALFSRYFSRLISCIFILLIVTTGLIGTFQNLSYVNFLWRSQKWLLVNDSSYNWGQENYRATKYIYDNYYADLLSASDQDLIISSFGSSNIGRELKLIDKNFSNPNLNKATLEAKYFTENLIDNRKSYSSHSKIIIIDSEVVQKLYLCQNNNYICKANFEFFQNTKPIYTNNQVIYVYKLG
ncbi:MAG: hypothetical protein H7230_01300 [Candidatus Parcubacteria bacterium]|nr:hypothetical protein [Candidatus Paceibacterota bacterium]